MKHFGRALILIGILFVFFGIYLIWQRNSPQRVSFKNSVVNREATRKTPSVFIITERDIRLPVVQAKIINQNWEVTDKGISAIGNVFYGHNWTNLLGKLINVIPGDNIEIIYSDGTTAKFKVKITQVVDPDQKDVLNLAGDNTIIVYTCTGFLDSKRFIVVASKI